MAIGDFCRAEGFPTAGAHQPLNVRQPGLKIIVEHLEADLAVARGAWGHVEDPVAGAVPDRERPLSIDAVRVLLQRVGPQLAARAHSARLLEQALTATWSAPNTRSGMLSSVWPTQRRQPW
jgi:hypothetical protein